MGVLLVQGYTLTWSVVTPLLHPQQLNNLKQWIPESTHFKTVPENISYLWQSLTSMYKSSTGVDICSAEPWARMPPSAKFSQNTPSVGSTFPSSTWTREESKTQGRRINPFSLSCLSSTWAQGKSSHGVTSACLPMPSACAGKKSAKGCREHLPATGFGRWLHWRGGSIPTEWWRGPSTWTNIIGKYYVSCTEGHE